MSLSPIAKITVQSDIIDIPGLGYRAGFEGTLEVYPTEDAEVYHLKRRERTDEGAAGQDYAVAVDDLSETLATLAEVMTQEAVERMGS